MAFIDNYNFTELKNEAEKLIINDLGRQLDALPGPICRCNECILDMAAMALNIVKPLYRVSLLGSLYAASLDEEGEYAKSIKEAVSNAIEKVRQNPSHDVDFDEPSEVS